MKSQRITIIGFVILSAISLTTLWLAALAPAQPVGASQPIHFERYAEKTYTKPTILAPLSIVFPPPLPGEPWFAQDSIHVHPEPVIPGQPVEICAEVLNTDATEPQLAVLEFGVAPLGIGLPYDYIGVVEIEVPPAGHAVGCIGWVPPEPGSWGIEVLIPGDPEPQRILRNIDIDEPLQPGMPHERIFLVHNPTDQDQSISLDLQTNSELQGWQFELSQDNISDLPPGADWEVSLIVTPPADQPLPFDGTYIVDVEGSILDQSIGGFRKIFRPPVPLHRFPDPTYAEGEISVFPYPSQAGEPVEICVELFNPTSIPQEVVIQFSWANFGIGLPFSPINGPIVVEIPPHSVIRECIHWVPPIGGHLCLQVELFMDNQHPQRSQRNLDVNEPLIPGEPHDLVFPVGNPLEEQVTISLGLIPHLPGWEFSLAPDMLPEMQPGEIREVTLTVQPPPGEDLPPDGQPIVDVEAFVGDELIGGFRKIFRPPVPLHIFPDPPYAEREISVHPYPPKAGEPTEICVELRNPTPFPQEVNIQFSWAHFGIGLPFTPINGLKTVILPPFSIVRECIHWVPPIDGQVCLQVELFKDDYPVQWSQLNLDVDEPLEPGVPHARLFQVGNPFDHPVTVTFGVIPHLPEWEISISEDVLLDMAPGEVRDVTLAVTPTIDMPPDEHPVVDIEAFGDGVFIGGFRKIYRPPVPIHRPKDPIYAESEIFIHPYPPRAHEPTEVGVEIRNPTEEHQWITVTFSAANFGIGLPFVPIYEPIVVVVPPAGIIHPAIMWLPPHGGLWCIQVELEIPGSDDIFYSQRNIDVGEPFEPLITHPRPFLVGNPNEEPITITLGLIPHLPNWNLALSEDVLPNMAPGEIREVVLSVTPPEDLPPDEHPVVDVEAFSDGVLMGGFRKIYRPPVPIHRPKDPVYAESEIGVDPYPILPGQPVELSVELFNPTDQDRIVTTTFSVANFGIGLPFSAAFIAPNPIQIFVPAFGAARGHVIWTPPNWEGKFCVRVELEMGGHEILWSQRNIDVGEPLEPGKPHALDFLVGGWPFQERVTVTLGTILHQEGWEASLSHQELTNVAPGTPVTVTLTVTPPEDAELGNGDPIVDVEAFVNGELIGGFRKMNIPPFPLHKPHEKGYAESEILIEPYPPTLGVEATVSTVIQNNGDVIESIDLEFGWAKFGMGIPFTTTGISPHTSSLTINPGMTETVSTTWIPSMSGPQCVIIKLMDPDEVYEPQESQRNVYIEDKPPCDQTQIFTFTVYNDSAFTTTVDVGAITFNVPEDWKITVVPSPTMDIGPFSEEVVTVTVNIPCPNTVMAVFAQNTIQAIQTQAGSVPTIDVEGYNKGVLVGGIELQFPKALVTLWRYLFLPIIR